MRSALSPSGRCSTPFSGGSPTWRSGSTRTPPTPPSPLRPTRPRSNDDRRLLPRGRSGADSLAIVTTPEIAKKLGKKDPVKVKSLQIAVTSGQESLGQTWDGTHLETTTQAAKKAYEEAGVKNPREEISMMELHDCFSITELVTYEDLGISPRGGAPRDVQDGFYNLDGKIPAQPDGGLKCFGHPIGASGIRMLYEMYLQLNGRAGDRQLKDPRLGLTHNLGGFPAMSVCSIAIVGK